MVYLKCFLSFSLPVFSPCVSAPLTPLAHLSSWKARSFSPVTSAIGGDFTQGGSGPLFSSPFISPKFKPLCHLIILSGIICHCQPQHYFMLFTSLACSGPEVLHKTYIANISRRTWDNAILNKQKMRIYYTMHKKVVKFFPPGCFGG